MPQPQPNQPTAQPIFQAPVMNQQQPIIVNQYNPVQPLDLKTSPTTVVCPFCKQTVTTIVETECSGASVCCCICTSLVCWVIFQICRNKDLNCNDATHKCPSCGNTIATYTAC